MTKYCGHNIERTIICAFYMKNTETYNRTLSLVSYRPKDCKIASMTFVATETAREVEKASFYFLCRGQNYGC